MDGLQKRLNTSIQFKLSFTLAVVILVLAALAGVFSYLSALDEAHDLQDDVLLQVARLVDREVLTAPVPVRTDHGKTADNESRVFVQRLGETNPALIGEGEGQVLPLPVTLKEGLQTVDVQGESFRVLVKTTAAGERLAVAQEAGLRNEIAQDGAWRTVMPFLVLVPLLLLIVADLVRKLFRPIAALAHEVDTRDEAALHPLGDQALPTEIRPFVTAINRLLTRTARSMELQRRFIADAAHELRSPLTALSLQAERLSDLELSASAQERLKALHEGITRGRQLLEQMLALAHVQSATESASGPVSVQDIFHRVLEDLLPLAEAKQLDLGAESIWDVNLEVNARDLFVLIRNLVDNAIRYTPAGGRVDLAAEHHPDGVLLRIQDNGPGIPETERQRVFAPFYRMAGSDAPGAGLGLAIVEVIAKRLGAQITLSAADPLRKSGLCVAVLLPHAASRHA